MKRWFLSAASVLVLALAGCGDGSESPIAPSGPAYNGGLVVGGNSVETAPPPTTASDSTNTSERGGLVVGGN